jgi:hypothetical protein
MGQLGEVLMKPDGKDFVFVKTALEMRAGQVARISHWQRKMQTTDRFTCDFESILAGSIQAQST